MTENIFKTTKESITVFRQMIDSANKEHREALQKISGNYKGDMYIKMRDQENAEHKTRLNDLRTVAYNDIYEEIKSVREQILSKMKKKDFKMLSELSSLSGMRLSQAEFNLLYREYSGNYWNIRRLSEIAQEQGLEMPERFAPIDKQLAALDELQEATRLFIFGTDKEAGEVFDKYGHKQTFPGYGEPDLKPNSYEQNLLVSDEEIGRMEAMYLAENPLFSEGVLIDDVIKGLSDVDGSINKMHYLNNRLSNMTKKQIEETVSRLSKSKSSDVQLALSLSDFSFIMAENKEDIVPAAEMEK